MKNLFVETQCTIPFTDIISLPQSNYYSCHNFYKNIYYLIECNENLIHVIDIENNTHLIKQIQVNLPESKAVGIECTNNNEIYVGYNCGFVYELKEFNDKWYETSEVAEFGSGLDCMKLSPDNEIIVFVTKDLTVSVLSCKYFDCLNNTNLTTTEFGEKEFVTVGWGKKETQFHGSAGKAAAKEKVTEFRKTDTDNGLTVITWNALSALFAVSYIDETNNSRRFRIFDRKGVLQYTSELIDGLEGTLAWKASDNLIASTRKLPNKHTVAIFNKNGLLHREFTLPFNTKQIKIEELIWSTDSDILGIWYKDLITSQIFVQLWSQNNYHWYLKQTIVYPKKYPILFVGWYPQVNTNLLIISLQSSTIYTLYWGISHSNGKQESDKAVVSVINGRQVYVTKFKYFVIPPPMCQQKLEFKETVNAVSFAPNYPENLENNTNDFLVLLSNNKIVLCKDQSNELHLQYIYKTYNISLSIKNGHQYSFNLVQHLFWYKRDVLLCSVTIGKKSSLYELHLLHIDALDEILIDARLIQEMPGKIQHIILSSDSRMAYVVVNNHIYNYNDRDGVSKSDMTISREKFSRTVVKIAAVKFSKEEVIIALTSNHVLYANGNQIINNVTSFFVHSDSLLITTQQHTLICFDLNSIGLNQLLTKDLTIQPWENKNNMHVSELGIRRTERGSSLVMVVSKTDRVILQMPRGNLEMIQHRTLTIGIIKPLLDGLKYKEAVEIMRKQQINFNLFYDHDPELFMNNAEKFVNDLNARNLTIFLTDLNNDDVSCTLYNNNYVDRVKQQTVHSQKIDVVCELLKTIMEKNPNVLMEPIIVSLVKKGKTKGIEEALRILYKLSQCDGENDAKEKLARLHFEVGNKNLFDIALGTYDLHLALFVSEATHNSSRENVDFLNSFVDLEKDYMRYKIDLHLKRYASALENLAKLPERFDECMKLIREHELYAKGLKLFSGMRHRYVEISRAYAETFESKGKYEEAGILYIKANELYKALVAYKKANNWQEAIAVAFKMNLSAPLLNNLYRESVEQLEKENKYKEAATILSKHLNKMEDAVAMLCMGREWLQAWTEASYINRLDLIESLVKPSILQHSEFLIERLRLCKKDFEAHASRLANVRPQLLERRLALNELGHNLAGETDEIEEIGDRSVADSTETQSSRLSRSSNRTYRSSKNRRKHERKMCSTKHGSLYEDFGLIRALHHLVSQAYEYRDDVKSAAKMLLYINDDKFAQDLQIEMNAFLNCIGKRKHEIWPPIHENPIFKVNLMDDMPRDKQTWIESHLLFAPEEKSSNWKLEIFELL